MGQRTRRDFFLQPDHKTLNELDKVGNVVGKKHDRFAIKIFMENADSILIAHALAHDYTVVSQEVIKPTKAKIKIPCVCDYLSVECNDTFKMLREEGARFILEAHR